MTADWNKFCKYSQSFVSWLRLWIFIDVVFATPPFLLHGAESFLWNSPHVMEPEGSIPHSQVPTICLYPELHRSSPCFLTPLLYDQFYYYSLLVIQKNSNHFLVNYCVSNCVPCELRIESLRIMFIQFSPPKIHYHLHYNTQPSIQWGTGVITWRKDRALCWSPKSI